VNWVQLRWEMIVCFDDIGGIDDQHYLSFLLIIILKTSEIMFTHCIFPKGNIVYRRSESSSDQGIYYKIRLMTFYLSIILDLQNFFHWYILQSWKLKRPPILCRDGIYFDKILVSEYKLFKRSNKANLFIALVQ
jgi:hypothetical protein